VIRMISKPKTKYIFIHTHHASNLVICRYIMFSFVPSSLSTNGCHKKCLDSLMQTHVSKTETEGVAKGSLENPTVVASA
jgi:hypothetical protein